MNEKMLSLALKPVADLSDEERRVIASRIENTKEIVVKQATEEKIIRYVKGYWDGDAKIIKEIVDWGRSIIPECVVNGDIGAIETHKNAIRSILFHTRFRGPLKVLVLKHLGMILKDAVLFNKGQDGDESFYNLAHRLRFEPGDGKPAKEFVARLIVKETADGNRTWTVEFSNKRELTGMPTTGEAATVEVTHLKSPSTHTILKKIYAVNGTDITVIILIGQEKIHLKRCVEKLAALNPRQIFLVESQPDDGGVAIAKETAAKLGLRLETLYHKWPGLYAEQFQWAMSEVEKVGGSGEWILRLDADEYLTNDTVENLKQVLCGPCGPRGARSLPDGARSLPGGRGLPDEVAGLTLELKRIIFGGEIRHATNGIRLLRIFRRGRAKIEQRAMDEHMLVDGKVIDFDGAFYDHNLNSFEWWQNKHRGYAKREALDAIQLFNDPERLKRPSPTDRKKMTYYKLPRYLRAVMYFCIRYFLKGGFLDGMPGWRWNFWQGLWYRWIVDVEIGRMSRNPKSLA